MMKRNALLALLIVAVAATALAGPKPDKIVSYKKVDGHNLKMHIFNPSGHKPSDKTPAIVLFHGGGWKNGDPSRFYRHAKYLASRGMVAICPVYRIQNKHGTTPKECVQDAKSAIRWVRRHADELGVDPKRLVAAGGSAGGHMAAATALVKGFDEPGEDTSIDCRPNALVLYNPVFDNSENGYGYDRVKGYWKEFSPMHNIDKTAPPTLVMLGTEDHLIPVATAKKYKQLMDEAGARCELILYKKGKHGFFNRGSNFYKTLRATDRFLSSLGYLKGKPTLKVKK